MVRVIYTYFLKICGFCEMKLYRSTFLYIFRRGHISIFHARAESLPPANFFYIHFGARINFSSIVFSHMILIFRHWEVALSAFRIELSARLCNRRRGRLKQSLLNLWETFTPSSKSSTVKATIAQRFISKLNKLSLRNFMDICISFIAFSLKNGHDCFFIIRT